MATPEESNELWDGGEETIMEGGRSEQLSWSTRRGRFSSAGTTTDLMCKTPQAEMGIRVLMEKGVGRPWEAYLDDGNI